MNYGDFSNPKGGYNKPDSTNPYGIAPFENKDEPKKDRSIIFFVNGHWNSWLDSNVGPASGGIWYWQFFNSGKNQFSDFLFKAVKYFNINTPVDFKFIDGSSLIAGDDSGQDRKERGEDYARSNFEKYKDILLTNKIYFVSHSEGGAFATGMAKYFVENKINVVESILLACDEADEFKIDFELKCYQIELMFWVLFGLTSYAPVFDWVINSKLKDGGVGGVTKFGVIIEAGKYTGAGTIHAGDLIKPSVFERINQLKKVRTFEKKNSKGEKYFIQLGAEIKFYQVNKNVVLSNHPNWDNLNKKIDLEKINQ